MVLPARRTKSSPFGLGSMGGRRVSHTFQLIVFDYDGTLVDSPHIITRAMSEGFAAHGLAPPRAEDVRRVVGLTLERAVANLLPEPGDVATAARVAEGYRQAFFALRTQPDCYEPLFPGARETLIELGQGDVRLGIATGKARRGLLASLERHGLTEHFTTLQTADIAAGKPHPEMLNRAMSEAGTTVQDTVLIGDTTFDMAMAVNAGTAGVGVAWGYHEPEELRQNGAAVIVESFGDLPDALSTLSVARS